MRVGPRLQTQHQQGFKLYDIGPCPMSITHPRRKSGLQKQRSRVYNALFSSPINGQDLNYVTLTQTACKCLCDGYQSIYCITQTSLRLSSSLARVTNSVSFVILIWAGRGGPRKLDWGGGTGVWGRSPLQGLRANSRWGSGERSYPEAEAFLSYLVLKIFVSIHPWSYRPSKN
jgi:hypothetical protein